MLLFTLLFDRNIKHKNKQTITLAFQKGSQNSLPTNPKFLGWVVCHTGISLVVQ